MHRALNPVTSPPHLELLQGGRARAWHREGFEVVVATPDSPPFAVQRSVVEEDRWRVLGASPEWHPPAPEHPVRLHTALVSEQPTALGRILRRDTHWCAVVVDLDAERLVDGAVVAAAWAGIAGRCAREDVRRLAVPLLGAVHGDLAPRVALRLLHDGLLAVPPAPLRRVWLQVPPRHLEVAERTLASWAASGG